MNEMSPRLLGSDPFSMTREYFIPSEDGKSFTIATETDYTPVCEYNQELRKGTKARDRWGHGQLVASLPPTVWMDLWRKGIMQDDPALRRWLNDETNVVFRRRFGRV